MKYMILTLITIFLASCSGVQDQMPITTHIETTSLLVTETQAVINKTPTGGVETFMAESLSDVIGAQAAISTATPLLSTTPLPPQATSLPVSIMPTTTIMENGLEWTECVVPNRDYANTDKKFLEQCIDIPEWDENDKERMGERVEAQPSLGDLRITIGNDHFETKLENISNGCCRYELIKNGEVILKITPGFMTSDPNINFWNIGGKLVWELSGATPVIVVDGVNFNEKYQLDGSFFPYEINGKLIYIAKKNGKSQIVYDDKVMGPEFDQIYKAYCCGMISVYYGQGQYWFVGRREDTKFVILIR